MKVGVIIFDPNSSMLAGDRAVPDKAWASVNGEEAFRVGAVHDLPSDVLWLTNLNYNNFYNAGLTRHPNFRSDGYLRSSVPQICAELGLDFSSHALSEIASVLSQIMGRTVSYVFRHVRDARIECKTLNADIARALKAPESQIPDQFYPLFDPIARHSSGAVVRDIRFSQRLPTVTLRRNRVLHARDVLAFPAPGDACWEYRSEKGLVEGDLESLQTPFLVHCHLDGVSPVAAEILSCAGGSKKMRDWLTDHEWRTLRKYGRMHVKGVLVSSSPAAPSAQNALITDNELLPLSYTAGLFAEQLWTGMTLQQPYRQKESRFTAAAVWRMSYDRTVMLEYAQKLSARGLTVISYGAGNVVVSYPDGGLRRALGIAADLGLLAPANKFTEARIRGE